MRILVGLMLLGALSAYGQDGVERDLRFPKPGFRADPPVNLPQGAPDPETADAQMPEQARQALVDLDSNDFQTREDAADRLFDLGIAAVAPLRMAAEVGSPEVAARSFEVLQRLYMVSDDATNEAVDEAFRYLTRVENLTATARSERILESVSEVRQARAVAKLERLGAIVHETENNLDRPRPRIDHVMFGRDWAGTDDDVRLIERIEDLRLADIPTIYVVKGVNISEETKFALRVNLPTLDIQNRGPARLGVTNLLTREAGCFIGFVEPDSAADGAGLKPSDQIMEIDGKPVVSFAGLIEVIGEKEPGDMVPIVYIRDGQTRQTEAKLSAWSKKKRPAVAPPKPQP